MGSCKGGCGARLGREDPTGRLATQLPAQTEVVLSLDFERARKSALWKVLSELADTAAVNEDGALVAELTRKTGLRPFEDVHRVVAAFPEEARQTGTFALVFETESLEPERLVSYAKEEAKARGSELVSRRHAGFTLWSSQKPGGPAGFFDGKERVVLAGGGWAEAMAELSAAGQNAPAGKNTRGNEALWSLVRRLGTAHTVWLAALVPSATRKRLMADPRFGAQASVMRFGFTADLHPGLDLRLLAELSNAEDARVLVGKVQTFLAAASKSPEVLLLGLGPALDGVSAKAEGPRARIEVELDEGQTRDLLLRLQAFVGLRRQGKEVPAEPPSQ